MNSISEATPKFCEYCKYMNEDNMKYDADKTTPGTTTPIITTPKNFPNKANIGLKTAYDTMLTNRRRASQSLSSPFISFTGAYSPGWTFGLPFQGFFITHMQTHGRTPLDE
jgi:hypothetical protein